MQLNTAAPGPISAQTEAEQLVNGVGGGGADLAAVTVENAGRIELFGSISGLAEAEAATAVTFGEGVAPSPSQQVNDCPLSGLIACGISVEFIPRSGPRPDPGTPLGATPDPELLFGRFLDLGLNDPRLIAYEPPTNRGNDEEYPE